MKKKQDEICELYQEAKEKWLEWQFTIQEKNKIETFINMMVCCENCNTDFCIKFFQTYMQTKNIIQKKHLVIRVWASFYDLSSIKQLQLKNKLIDLWNEWKLSIIQDLSKSLQSKHCTVKLLFLWWNKIWDSHAKIIIIALKINKSITQVDFTWNNISKKAKKRFQNMKDIRPNVCIKF